MPKDRHPLANRSGWW